jgi:hypothetical protein
LISLLESGGAVARLGYFRAETVAFVAAARYL